MTMLLKHAMRPAQRECFLWLLDLLVDAAALESHSSMGVSALATIFAPVLMPPAACLPVEEQIRRVKDGIALCQQLIIYHKKQALTEKKETVVPQPPKLSRLHSSGTKRKILVAPESRDDTDHDYEQPQAQPDGSSSHEHEIVLEI